MTIHAGEASGIESIRSAIDDCGADRIGHGVRITDDLTQSKAVVSLGPVAKETWYRRIPLELCITSNVDTGAVRSVAHHPAALLQRLGFEVTVSTDNRSISGVSLTDEFQILVEHHGLTLDDLEALTDCALRAAFCPNELKRHISENVVRPGFSAIRREIEMSSD